MGLPPQVLTLLQSDQWRCARLSFQTVKNNGLVICSMWGCFAFSHLLGMEMEDPSPQRSGPFDFRACTNPQFNAQARGNSTLKIALRAHSRTELLGVQRQGLTGWWALLLPGCPWDQFCIV